MIGLSDRLFVVEHSEVLLETEKGKLGSLSYTPFLATHARSEVAGACIVRFLIPMHEPSSLA